jgi:acyl-CoA synthetase (NDP forming)
MARKATRIMKLSSQMLSKTVKEGRKFLLEPEAKAVCMEYGIPVTKFKVAKNEAEAVKFAEEIGFPVVLKIVSPDIIHKSDVGGVVVGLKTAKDV